MSQQQLQQIIQMLKAQPIETNAPIAETRAGFEQMAGMVPIDADVKCEPVNAGGIKPEYITPPGADADGAVLDQHRGGNVIRSVNHAIRPPARIRPRRNGPEKLTAYSP